MNDEELNRKIMAQVIGERDLAMHRVQTLEAALNAKRANDRENLRTAIIKWLESLHTGSWGRNFQLNDATDRWVLADHLIDTLFYPVQEHMPR